MYKLEVVIILLLLTVLGLEIYKIVVKKESYGSSSSMSSQRTQGSSRPSPGSIVQKGVSPTDNPAIKQVIQARFQGQTISDPASAHVYGGTPTYQTAPPSGTPALTGVAAVIAARQAGTVIRT